MSRAVTLSAFTTEYLRSTPRTVEQNLDWTCETIDLLSPEKPDLICLTEVFDARELPGTCLDKAQTIDGPTFTRMAAKARQYSCYIICPFIEMRDGLAYNTCAVIDRQGNLIGRYDKIHPTTTEAYHADYEGEIEQNIIPGKPEPKVFETDFGRIGCQICFDANWPDNWRDLKRAGAELICFASAFSAGRLLQSMATIYHIPIVAACRYQTCRIVDRDGLVVNYQGNYQRWVTATLDLDNYLIHLDGHWEKLEKIRAELGPRVQIKVYEEEGWWRILPRDPSIEILDLFEKYDLLPLDEYFRRAGEIQERVQKTARKPAKALASSSA
jgi:beta-ureidopropionase